MAKDSNPIDALILKTKGPPAVADDEYGDVKAMVRPHMEALAAALKAGDIDAATDAFCDAMAAHGGE